MKFTVYFKFLILATLVSMALFVSLAALLPLRAHINMFWGSLLGFAILSTTIYFLVELSIQRTGGKGILGIAIYNVILRVVFSFGFVGLYVKANQPQDNYFLLPFFISYIVFTVFETWSLDIQARSSK